VADEGAQHRPRLEEQVLVEVAGQVVAQALMQDGAEQALETCEAAYVPAL